MAEGKNDNKPDDKKNGAKSNGDNQDVFTSIFSKLDVLTREANDRAANTDSILKGISDKVDKFSASVSNINEEQPAGK